MFQVHMVSDPTEPFCSNCGYALKALTDSSKCPECGKPLVEVLSRPAMERLGRRWQSKARIFGLPLVSVASGPYGHERIGRPRGVIAIGDMPVGVIAIGGFARGVLAIGGIAVGLIGWGGICVAAAAMGGVAIGIGAVGGIALGIWSLGGAAFYVFRGVGGLKIHVRF
jgi:predicted RNA-binding Zn-ribbon protein involved in translation (DUF1610 family)